MSRIYLASSWRNERQPLLVKSLRASGHEVYDFRQPWPGQEGFSWRKLENGKSWQEWSREEYREQLFRHPQAAAGYIADLRAMEWADTCILYLPCGNSAHMEAGYFSGARKRLIIYIDKHATWQPDLMYLLANFIVFNSAELDEALK